MNKSDFGKIENRLKQLIEEQDNLITRVKGNPEVSNWTIEQLRNNVKKARKLQQSQDLFLTADLYHLIGMGKMTVGQTNTILKLSRTMTTSRSILKQIAALATVDNCFNLTTNDFSKEIGKGKYNSTLLNIKLEET